MKRASEILVDRAGVSSRDEDAFFAKLRLPNGTFKTTGAGRLIALDQWLADRITQPSVQLLDVAVSSGVTTVDLIDTLEARGINASVTACDLCITAYIRQMAPGVEVLLDSQGHVLQMATPMGVKGRPHDPGGSLARSALAATFRVVEGLCRIGIAGPRSSDQHVQLVSRRLKEHAEVDVVEHDLFGARPAWEGRFDLVRAANILNRDYFDDAQLMHVARILGTYLRVGGRLLVARTDHANDTTASLFERTAEGTFTLVDRYSTGSYIEGLVLVAHERPASGGNA